MWHMSFCTSFATVPLNPSISDQVAGLVLTASILSLQVPFSHKFVKINTHLKYISLINIVGNKSCRSFQNPFR